LKNWDSIENQALQGAEVSKRMKIHGAKYGDLEDKLFKWFCFLRSNNIPMEGPTMKDKANEIAVKLCSVFKWLAPAIQTTMEHHMASHEWRGFFCRYRGFQ
jgi:hypothetical protein